MTALLPLVEGKLGSNQDEIYIKMRISFTVTPTNFFCQRITIFVHSFRFT
jgi:hypothetical protein